MLNVLTQLILSAKNSVKRILSDEKGEVNVVAIVLLIGVAVILVAVFKDAIVGLLNSLLETIKGNATSVISGTD